MKSFPNFNAEGCESAHVALDRLLAKIKSAIASNPASPIECNEIKLRPMNEQGKPAMAWAKLSITLHS